MWGAHWSILLEKAGVPGVYVVDEPFRADVQISCEKEGMAVLRRVVVRHPCGDVTDAELPAVMSELLTALTSPLTDKEKSPPKKEVKQQTRVVFNGTLDEVQAFYYRSGWTDGLPILPPTEEAVRAMLKGTNHAPDDIVSKEMLPESQIVTVEKVATVGVMAGCEPRYMPVLLAMVEAMSDERFSSSVRSTSSFSFVTVVNGPVAKQIGMNSGINALGSGTGNKANATIGRFQRLAFICLGGSRSGVSDLSSLGNPGKYSFAFAENEAKSPWEPFHVSCGFKTDESVISMLSGGWSHHSPYGEVDLNHVAKSIATYELPTGVLVFMDPMWARRVSDKGFTKQQAEKYIHSHATRKAKDFKSDFFYAPFIEPSLKGKPWYGQKGLWPARYLDVPPEEEIPIFPEDSILIVVVGGESNPFVQTWQFSRPRSVLVDKWR
ncbi:MAG TPA: hypothetical protein VMT62_13065 [Syntrophorhabdaceae bacterium]|nr:hypothetical protein [Syntrophorhabdaceae bacterium]